MVSLVSLRKSPPFILQVASHQWLGARLLSSSSSRSSYSKSNDGGSESHGRVLDFLSSASPGVVILGIVLGFNHCSSSSVKSNGVLSFADFPKESAWTTKEDDHLHHPTYQETKKSNFLFGGVSQKQELGCFPSFHDISETSILDDSLCIQEESIFNYEKRMRLQSSPEKVFEYFASIHTKAGEIFMTPGDLMRAVVPIFPPSESDRVREGFLRGEQVSSNLRCAPSEFFMLFDTNNDGLISFAEYIFFVTLLSIPESSFSVAFKMFDLDNNGKIDREEFKKVMALMRSRNRQGADHRDGRRLGPKVSVENGGLVEYFFGKDGMSCLKHESFVQFLRELHNEILRLEFAHYDYRSEGSISAKDFALSLVASADINHINKLLDQVDTLNQKPSLNNIRISFQEFKNFADLRKQLESFSLAIFSFGKVNGVLTKQDFQRAASQVCEVSITSNVVDIIFHLFDANGDGNLSSDEFVRVIQRRETNISNGGFSGLISCWLNCARNCSSTKLFS